MVKYSAYGLKDEDLHEPYEKVLPDRVKKLIELYHEQHIEYIWTEEDRNERIFDYRRSQKSSTYKYDIQAIYRVRDPYDKSKEYYFYQKEGTCLNDNGDPERSGSYTYGYASIPIHELRWNPKTKRKEPFKLRDDPVYFYKWDRKEVAKLLDGSTIPCQNFYIGIASSKGQGNLASASELKAIKNRDDFLNGDYDSLALLNRAGIMDVNVSTLSMIDKARSKFEDEQLRRIAQVANPQQQPQPQSK
jgi:hypothetical protein